MSKKNREWEQVVFAMEEWLQSDPHGQFCIEPGRGMTYNTFKPTLYFYSVYEESSVLAGQTRRVFVWQFDEDEDVQEFLQFANDEGKTVDVFEYSQFTPPRLDHLPDDTDY